MKSCLSCDGGKVQPFELEERLVGGRCEGCGGTWIGKENYERWLKKKGGVEPELPEDFGFDVVNQDPERARVCPDCSKIMIKARVGRGLSYFVDRCSGCQGLWLDPKEWESLKSRALHDEIYMMYTAVWKRRELEER